MTFNSTRFDNEGFIILGNAAETGHNVAVAAARQGARVVLGLRGEENKPEIDRERISVIVTEMSESGIKHLFDRSLERLVDLTVLIHCLSAPKAIGESFAKTSRDEWDRMMSVCLREPFLSSQCAIQEFLATGKGGRIIFVLPGTSGGTNNQFGYSVVQSALYAFMRSIAKEYGRRGILCNAVTIRNDDGSEQMPGPSDTCDGVTETLLFLASCDASFVNGEMIPVTNSAPRGASIRW